MRFSFSPARPALLALALALAVSACTGGGDKGSDSTAAPALDTAAPVTGPAGTAVTIAGEHFGDEPGDDGLVRFGGILAPVQSWSDTSIVATVPGGAYPGSRDVQVVTSVGSSNTLAFTVLLPRAIYVNDDIPLATGPNSIETFSVDATGATSPIGSPLVQGVTGPGYGGFFAGTIAAHAGTRRVVTSAFGTLTSWDIDPVTGALASSGTFALTGGDYAYGLKMSADGTRAYVGDFDGSQVVGVSVAEDGTFASLSGSPYDAGTMAGTSALAFSVDQTYLYTLNESVAAGALHGYLVGANGSLAELAGSPYDLAERSYTFERAPDADHFYVSGLAYIAIFEPDANGDLAENVGLRETMPARAYLSLSGDGDRLFAVIDNTPAPNETDLYVFDVASSGGLVAVSGSPFTLTGFPTGATIVRANEDGSTIVVKDAGQAAIHLYTVDGGGLPTEVAGSPFSLEAGAQASGIAFTF